MKKQIANFRQFVKLYENVDPNNFDPEVIKFIETDGLNADLFTKEGTGAYVFRGGDGPGRPTVNFTLDEVKIYNKAVASDPMAAVSCTRNKTTNPNCATILKLTKIKELSLDRF
jgi:hypothetical protein